MRTFLISLALCLFSSSIAFSSNIIKKNTNFTKKSFLSTSVQNTGLETVNANSSIIESMGSIAIADIVSYSSVSPMKEVNATRSVYTYLRANSTDVVNGEVYIYSDIIEVYQPLVVEKGSSVIVQREELIASFQNELYQKFPKRSFSVSIESVQGLFNSYDEALNAQKDCKSTKSTIAELD